MADTFVTVTGNLTDDPELRFTPNGTEVANFRLAVTTRIRDDAGGWTDGDTHFFRVNVWRDQAENVADSLIKGSRAVVIGRLKTRSWQTDDGEPRSVVEIEADEVAVSLRWATAKPERRNGKKGKANGDDTSSTNSKDTTTGRRTTKTRRARS
jgi:single-strand DNA-binding protein